MAKHKSEIKKHPFTQWGDPVLSTPTRPLTAAYVKSSEFRKTIARMFRMIKGIGVGLAANQIGLPMKFAVIMIKPNPSRPSLVPLPETAIVNPKIIRYSREKQSGWEGCLSGALDRFFVERAKWIDVTYIDGKTGKKVNKRVDGFQAIVFQHEIDHLNGKVCGEQVMVRNRKVVPGAIITLDWYLKTKGAPPYGLKR